MKISTKKIIVLAGLVLGVALRSNAQVNVGFETGDFTGWNVNTGYAGSASVVTTETDFNNGDVYNAPYGKYFADLWAGAGANVYTTVSQTFNMTAGQTLYGAAAFLAHDYSPYNDNAYAAISATSGNTTLFYDDVNTVGDYNSTPWAYWSYTSTVTGPVTLTYAVENEGDNLLDSEALFDTSTVPDAGSTSALLGLALGGLAFVKRNSKNS
jgi:hypothetical protein